MIFYFRSHTFLYNIGQPFFLFRLIDMRYSWRNMTQISGNVCQKHHYPRKYSKLMSLTSWESDEKFATTNWSCVTEFVRKMFLFRSLRSTCLLSKMGHLVYPMVQCRWIQGIQKIHENLCCWHRLKCVGQYAPLQGHIQRKEPFLDDLSRNMNCCGRFEEACEGYWSGFSVKTGRPLDHSSSYLNSLKRIGINFLTRFVIAFFIAGVKKQLFRFSFFS